jgi:NCAIR mutase (PurE)-related protein
MNPDSLRQLLERLRRGELTVGEAMDHLRDLPFETLPDARVDHHRALRRGFPEVVYGAGKTPEQAVAIARAIAARGQTVLVTRATPEMAATLIADFPRAVHDPLARTVALRAGDVAPLAGRVLVVSAGTSDLPVAAEAQVTAETLGCQVERRLLREVEVIIAVAGMEGALPSVIAGLTDRPVIAVPTSVGYGASFAGLAALLGMLSSCAPGLTVVNIDNGFGAGYAAATFLRTAAELAGRSRASAPESAAAKAGEPAASEPKR